MRIAVLKLRRKSVAVIVETVRKVVTKMTGNLFFATPNPSLVTVTAQVDVLDTLDQETQQGGKDKNALKTLAKDKLFGMMTALTSYVQTTSLHPGEIILRWAGVYGRTEYFVQVSTDPNRPDSWTDVPNGHTGKARLVVPGLTPGQVYYFRIFTECAAGTSGPGEIANHMAA